MMIHYYFSGASEGLGAIGKRGRNPGGWGGGGEGCGTLLTHASAPRSLSAQHPMLLSISSGNNSGPTALFCACSINSIL